jgi:long-subunit fatty acid transport protein
VHNGDPNVAPSPTRYDVVTREATLLTPTLAASYRFLPNLDVGARFGVGFASLKSSVHIWSAPGNVVEDVGGDGLLRLKAKDNFVPQYGVGFAYRPAPAIELAGVYHSAVLIAAKGTAASELGPRSGSSGIPVMVVPIPDDFALCAKGGVVGALKACVSAELPRSALIGGRYKFLGAGGNERGDVELNVGWENWGNGASSDFKVKIDSEIVTEGGGGFSIKENQVRHGFRDVFTMRLGGSWKFPVGKNTLTARGGIAHDTAAAKPGWLRADIDGAARTTVALGAGFRTKRFQIDTGFGMVLEGKNDNAGDCNPISPNPDNLGCNRDGVERPIEDRRGPDPINPLLVPKQQLEAPVNQGVWEQRYVMFMLGASTWF